MRITAVEKTRKGRFGVCVDGLFAFSADAETVLLYRLEPGRELDDDAFEAVRSAAEQKYLKERALSLLSYKSYTKKELASRLARDGGGEAALEVADRMEELGLVNDEAYAARCASDLFQLKGYGGRRVVQELVHRGIPRALAEEAAGKLAPGQDDALDALIRRKYARYLADKAGIDKTVRALLRMGYPYDEIKSAISRHTGENPPDDWE